MKENNRAKLAGRRLLENTMHGLFLVLGLITVACVLLITV